MRTSERFAVHGIVSWIVFAALPLAGSFAAEPDVQAMRTAITKSIPLLQKGAEGSADARQCFTCHNQAMPVLALVEAQRRGFAVDEHVVQRQVKHTLDHLERGRENYQQGKGQGGAVITAGYALWALAAGQHKPDDVTSAVTSYLLQFQKEMDHWSHPGQRPPTSGSDFTTTYVALRGLTDFAPPEQRETADARIAQVRAWLLATKPVDTEDRVFRLLSLSLTQGKGDGTQAGADLVQAAADELAERQREDGGWAQTDDMSSDPYATATVLFALLYTGERSADDPAIERGVQYLLDTQLDDGSWHVGSRAQPFQTYYESGYPHGKDQFISIAAGAWATLVLLNIVERSE